MRPFNFSKIFKKCEDNCSKSILSIADPVKMPPWRRFWAKGGAGHKSSSFFEKKIFFLLKIDFYKEQITFSLFFSMLTT